MVLQSEISWNLNCLQENRYFGAIRGAITCKVKGLSLGTVPPCLIADPCVGQHRNDPQKVLNHRNLNIFVGRD